MSQPALPIEAHDHDPCCSSHGVPMDCERYRHTHFVEVRPCCSIDAARLRQEPPATPAVKAKAPKPEPKPRGPEPEHCPHCGRFMKGAYPVWQCLIHGTITA